MDFQPKEKKIRLCSNTTFCAVSFWGTYFSISK